MYRKSAESKEFYEIYDKGEDNGKIELSDNSVSLENDNKTVIITLNRNITDKLTNSSLAKVIVKKNIRAESGRKLAEEAIFDKVEVQDGIIPSVTKVKATGEKYLRITFSEPVYDRVKSIATDNFRVVCGVYEYFADKAYSIVDYAGHAVFRSSTTFDYIRDISSLLVTVKSAETNKVVLDFGKPVKGTDIKLYHTTKYDKSKVAKATVTDYQDEITFTYDGESITKLPVGENKLFLI